MGQNILDLGRAAPGCSLAYRWGITYFTGCNGYYTGIHWRRGYSETKILLLLLFLKIKELRHRRKALCWGPAQQTRGQVAGMPGPPEQLRLALRPSHRRLAQQRLPSPRVCCGKPWGAERKSSGAGETEPAKRHGKHISGCEGKGTRRHRP